MELFPEWYQNYIRRNSKPVAALLTLLGFIVLLVVMFIAVSIVVGLFLLLLKFLLPLLPSLPEVIPTIIGWIIVLGFWGFILFGALKTGWDAGKNDKKD